MSFHIEEQLFDNFLTFIILSTIDKMQYVINFDYLKCLFYLKQYMKIF